MHSTTTKNEFIELRAKGWSLARIAARTNVCVRTLVDWNRHSQAEIRALRAVELEALQEKILATHEQELTRLAQHLQRLEEEMIKRPLQFVDTKDLFRLSSLVRAEIRKVRLEPELVEDGPPAAAAGKPSL
jgi:hypothetical protein